MSQNDVRKLTIEHLRGSTVPFSLSFEKGKKLTIVYGENGTGKSTLCDAFEFLGKGRIGSLENRGLGKTGRYWYSVGKAASDVTVSLETASATCAGRIQKGEVVCIPPGVRPRVEVLRRNQILSLVEAKPGDRYAAISRFIDVAGVETSEASLRELIRDLTTSRGEAVARVQENQDAIHNFWEAAGKPGNDSLTWAEAECKREPKTFEAEIQALAALQAAYNRLTDYPERLKNSEKAVKAARETAVTSKQKEEQCMGNIAGDSGAVVDLLEAAKGYLHKHPAPAVCPLCESSEKAADLANRVTKRLATFSALQAAQRQNKTDQQAVQRAEQQLESIEQSAKTHAAEFQQCRNEHDWPNDIELPKTPAPENVTALADWLSSTAHLPAQWRKAETNRNDKSRFIETLKKAIKTCRENTKAQKDLDELLPKLKKALEIVEEERKRFTDGILAAIAGEGGRMYEAIHPGEGLNKISLELDPNRRASLEIGASFCGQSGTPPQAYFSDSHLDTFGLCTFLALAALDQPDNTILVLDDVLASVDEPHVERLIEMLYTEVLKFRHCVITTHYRPWKEKLRWGWLKNGQCQFVELSKWTASNGLMLLKSIPDTERLRQLLAETPPDPQLVCAKAGVILEAALDFLTQLYECAVPRRPNAVYTLGDLLPSVDKKLRQALKVEVLKEQDLVGTPTYSPVALAPILDELTRIAQARNVFGCHFNAMSFQLLDADAIGFGQQVLALMDALTDPTNGWPRSAKSGSYWATAGETRRLHPLKKPF